MDLMDMDDYNSTVVSINLESKPDSRVPQQNIETTVMVTDVTNGVEVLKKLPTESLIDFGGNGGDEISSAGAISTGIVDCDVVLGKNSIVPLFDPETKPTQDPSDLLSFGVGCLSSESLKLAKEKATDSYSDNKLTSFVSTSENVQIASHVSESTTGSNRKQAEKLTNSNSPENSVTVDELALAMAGTHNTASESAEGITAPSCSEVDPTAGAEVPVVQSTSPAAATAPSDVPGFDDADMNTRGDSLILPEGKEYISSESTPAEPSTDFLPSIDEIAHQVTGPEPTADTKGASVSSEKTQVVVLRELLNATGIALQVAVSTAKCTVASVRDLSHTSPIPLVPYSLPDPLCETSAASTKEVLLGLVNALSTRCRELEETIRKLTSKLDAVSTMHNISESGAVSASTSTMNEKEATGGSSSCGAAREDISVLEPAPAAPVVSTEKADEWEEINDWHPTPQYDLDSPVITHLLNTWTSDVGKVSKNIEM
jgi:hypothetical protein